MDRDAAKRVIEALKTAIEPTAGKHGLCLSPHTKATYTETSLTLTITLATLGHNAVLMDRDAQYLEQCGGAYGLKDNLLGQHVQYDGEWWTVAGLRPRRRNPLKVTRRKNGLTYFLPLSAGK